MSRLLGLVAVLMLFAGMARPAMAQTAPAMDEQIFRVSRANSDLKIIEKFARVFELPARVTTVYGFDAGVINITKVENSPNQIRVHALKPGITQVVMVDENGSNYTIQILVTGDVRHLQALINRLFPDANVEVVEVRDQDSVALRGWVTQPEHITNIVNVARRFYTEVLNHLQVGGVQQVMLRVKVMEVQRSRIRRLGMNFLYVDQTRYLASTPGLITPIGNLSVPFGGPPTVGVDVTQISNPSLSFGVVGTSSIFQGFLEALKQEGLLKIQAEPVLVTTNGRPARLTNGGEFPILTPAGLGTVGIEWREFGVELDAVPIILGNGRLRLEISPLVSERDFTNSVNISGLTVPGLTKRGVNTQVEMRFGETLMIGGLIAHRHTAETSKVPILGELPFIGGAFSRKRYDEVETELVILVTPEYVAAPEHGHLPKEGPGSFTTVPTDKELWDGMIEIPKYGDECQNCQPGYMLNGGTAMPCGPDGKCGQNGNCGPNGCAPPVQGGYQPGMAVPVEEGLISPSPYDTPMAPPHMGHEAMNGYPAADPGMPLLPGTETPMPLQPTPPVQPDFAPAPAAPGRPIAPGFPNDGGAVNFSPNSDPFLNTSGSGAPSTAPPQFSSYQPGSSPAVDPSATQSEMPGLIGPGFDNVPGSVNASPRSSSPPAMMVPPGF